MQRLTIMLLLLMFSVVANAQVYKWVDADGKTQYTDQPPPSGAGQNEEKLKIKPAPPSSYVKKPSDTDSVDGVAEDTKLNFSERRAARKEAKEEKEKQAEELNQKCIHAKGQLKMYRDTPRLRVPDGNGGIAYVDDNVREKHIQEAQENITAFCK